MFCNYITCLNYVNRKKHVLTKPGLVISILIFYYLFMQSERNIVPYFICEKAGIRQAGRITRAIMFADISGFTSLTESLMKKGKYGAEILSNILNELFGHIENAVYANNGFIASFAGDAFTGVFIDARHAVNAGIYIQKIMENHGNISTGNEHIKLSIKIGISYGSVSWGIPGKDNMYTFFFRGRTIDRSVQCQESCDPGNVIIDKPSFVRLKGENTFSPVKGMYRIEQYNAMDIEDNKIFKYCDNQHLFSDMFEGIMNADNEFRQVINIFINFKGFKQLYKMNDFIADVLATVKNTGGYFNSLDFGDKGNKMLVLFGAPVSRGNNIERALKFLNEIREKYGERIKAGITIGNVYAGFVGNKRCTYTVLGDAVNLSARLMSKAAWGRVLCDKLFMEQAKSLWHIEESGYEEIKGKKDAVMIYNVLNEIKNKQTAREPIGRDKELYMVKGIINDVRNGRNRGIVIIKGDSGTGKTLFTEYIEEIFHKDINIIRMRCDRVFKRSLNPFSSYMRQLFVNADDQTGLNKHWRKTADLIPELRNREAVIADIAGIFIRDEQYHNLPPKDKYNIKLFTLRDYFRHVLHKPLLLILDDMDYADSDSLKVLSMITDESMQMPYCMLMTASWKAVTDELSEQLPAVIITLNNLKGEDVRRIAENKLTKHISDEIHDIILSKTGGNPYFAEQLITYMNENKLIEEVNGAYEIIDKSAEIPSEISRVLIARIDALKPQLRNTVKHASVLGMEFSEIVLRHMLEAQHIDIELKEGIKRDIWSEIDENELMFKQGIFRDTVYDMQLRKKLKELHLKAAIILRMLYADENEYLYKIAYHYENAGYNSEAYHFYDRASEWDAENFRNEENLNILNSMLKLTDDKSKFSEIYIRIGDVYFYLGEMDRAIEYYNDAIDFGKESDNRLMQARAYISLSEIMRVRSKYEECIKYAEESRKISEEINSEEYVIRSLLMTGSIHMTQGRMDKSKNDFLLADSKAQHAEVDVLYENVCTNLGNYYWHLGQYKKAIASFNKAIDISERNNSIETMCSSYGNLGGVYWYMGDLKRSQKYYEKGIEMARQAGIKRIVSMLTGNMASIYITKGDYERAIEMLNFKIRATTEMGDKKGRAYALLNLGSIYFNSDEYEMAEKLYKETLGIFKPLHIRYGLGVVLGNLGELYLMNDRFDEAMECFMEKLELADNAGDNKMLANTYSAIGDVNIQTGNYDDALASYEKAYELAKEAGVNRSIINTLISAGVGLGKKGQFKEAEEKLSKALDSAEETESNVDICNVYRELAVLEKEQNDLDRALEYAEKSMQLSEKTKNSKNQQQAMLVKAEILSQHEPKQALMILKDIRTHSRRDELKLKYIKCLAKRDQGICNDIIDEFEQLFIKTGNIEYRERIQKIRKTINK